MSRKGQFLSFFIYCIWFSRWDNNCEKLEEYIPSWLNLGVKIVGGCCRVCADYIKKIKDEVKKWEAQQLGGVV